MVLCLSRIRPAFGVQAFSMQAFSTWPSVSGPWWYFGQVVSISGWPALFTTVFVGRRFSRARIAKRKSENDVKVPALSQ